MNIFEQYLDKIKEILSTLSSNGDLILPDSLNGVTAEIPPSKFDSDISTNVAMVLSKINNKSPLDLASFLIFSAKIEAKSDGDLLLILERTIATLVEISLSNFEGGISAVIPLSESGNVKSPLEDRVDKISFILSKYCSKIFI